MNSHSTAATRHPLGKALVVIAGPSLVTLIPMAAAPALPALAQAFAGSGDGAFFAQMVMTAPAIMIILGAPLAGMLTDIVGRRACLLGSLLLFALSGSACLVTPNATMLIAARLALGLAGGGLLTTALALAADFPDGGPRERLLGSLVACTAVVAIIALNFGGYLVDTFGWRGPFALYACGFVVLGVAGATVESHRAERSHAHSLVAPIRAYWAVYVMVVLLTIGMFMAPIQGAFLVQASGVTSAATGGLMVSACPLAAAFSAASFGWLAGRLDTRRLFALIALVYGVGGIVSALASVTAVVLIGFAFMGIGAGLVEATAARFILADAAPALRARAAGILMSAIFLGQFLNPLVVSPLRQMFDIDGAFLLVGAAFVVLAATLRFNWVQAWGFEPVLRRQQAQAGPVSV